MDFIFNLNRRVQDDTHNFIVENPMLDFFEKGFIRKQYSDDSFEFPCLHYSSLKIHITTHT